MALGGGEDPFLDDVPREPANRGIRRLRPIDKTAKGALVAIIAVSIAGVVVAAVLFTHTLSPPSTVGAVLTRGCEPALPFPPAGIPVGTSGFVIWNCGGTPPASAFTVNSAGSVTPTFTITTGWTDLYIFKAANLPTTNCASSSSERPLTSGSAVSFVAGDVGAWDYCSDYTNAPPTFGTMIVSWAQ